MKPYIIISGFNINDNNRGTAALSYGSIPFLLSHKYIKEGQILVNFRFYKNILRKRNRLDIKQSIPVENMKWQYITFNIFFVERWLFEKFGILLPFSKLKRILSNLELVAAINGGDGFSDIYSTKTFLSRLPDISYAMKIGIPVVLLPQTIGPFKYEQNYKIAVAILKYATHIYVRDDKFSADLDTLGLRYTLTKDLSYYMKPKQWDIIVKKVAVGLNISGLAYSNKFRTLSGEFDNYPLLVFEIIKYFQQKNIWLYLIPHSYNYSQPEESNDDLIASRDVYEKLNNKSNVLLIDRDLTSPEVKYLISKMSFFIGTRMHANFAAIYSGVPVFGLSYSYKFQGAFEANGVYNRVSSIVNIDSHDVKLIIDKIDTLFKEIYE
ncbi:MAG: polysaccharide pyruvyl transferase family protein [Bacteroidetes bacterium]|uniref:Polysaccharide pyruvyl transferase family protein n=1 Tax=Candidatus Cryptobacteroides excrementipullorum TaxID=2840761 RepID=A0A9D9ITD4_9BACT|nr:polysaccharide pyruvyl transferase family protein [Candidatus Cryptobacteroides excrementipullorum]